MLIENAAPRISAIVTGTDVRSLTEGDWKRLYQTWLDGHVLIVHGSETVEIRLQQLQPPLWTLEAASRQEHARSRADGGHVDGRHRNSPNDKLVLDRDQGWHTDGPWDVEIETALRTGWGLPVVERMAHPFAHDRMQ
jgi:hypothetical protein